MVNSIFTNIFESEYRRATISCYINTTKTRAWSTFSPFRWTCPCQCPRPSSWSTWARRPPRPSRPEGVALLSDTSQPAPGSQMYAGTSRLKERELVLRNPIKIQLTLELSLKIFFSITILGVMEVDKRQKQFPKTMQYLNKVELDLSYTYKFALVTASQLMLI